MLIGIIQSEWCYRKISEETNLSKIDILLKKGRILLGAILILKYMKGVMNLNKEIVEGMYIALIFIAGYYIVKTKRINILWKILAAVNILSWACLLVILALDINVSADFISLNLAACMSLAIFTPIIWFSDRKNMDIYSLFGNIGFVLVLNKEVNQIKNSARLRENLQKILGLDCYHKTWITISKTKDEEITLTMLFFSKKEFACFERKIDKKYIVEKENGFGTLVTMQI